MHPVFYCLSVTGGPTCSLVIRDKDSNSSEPSRVFTQRSPSRL